MTSKKVFFMMLGALVLAAILVIATTILGDTLLHKQSDKLVNLKLETQVIEDQQTALAQAKKDLLKYNDLSTIAKQVVPQDKDQARATREIISLAAQAGIKIASISFPASNLGQAQPKASPTTNSTTTTTDTATKAPPVTQVKPVEGIQGLYQLDINVVSDSGSPTTYPRLIDFLTRLEKNRRTAQVSQISIQPDAQDRNSLGFTLTITLYIKP